MDSCGMIDIGFTGSKYTWCNNRRPDKRIWKRLDRVFINDEWAQKYTNSSMRHLASTESDHRPMLLKCEKSQDRGIKYFQFLNFWTNQNGYMDVVKENWNQHVEGNSMWKLQQKLKRVRKRLSQWSRNEIGDMNGLVEEWESKIEYLENEDMMRMIETSR